jgi:hypothetical protein
MHLIVTLGPRKNRGACKSSAGANAGLFCCVLANAALGA